jgi:hypothetical protein
LPYASASGGFLPSDRYAVKVFLRKLILPSFIILIQFQGKAKYVFKQRLFVSDVGVSDVHEGGSDECKFAIWNNRSHSLPDGKIILKVKGLKRSPP